MRAAVGSTTLPGASGTTSVTSGGSAGRGSGGGGRGAVRGGRRGLCRKGRELDGIPADAYLELARQKPCPATRDRERELGCDARDRELVEQGGPELETQVDQRWDGGQDR